MFSRLVVLLGHPNLAVFPALGAFTITFERSLPPRRRSRLWVLALVAAAMTAAVGLGSLLAVQVGPSGPWNQGLAAVVGMAAVAGLAKFGCDYAGLRGLGAVLILVAFAITAEGTPALTDVLPHTALTALGAAIASLVCLPNSFQPQRLKRLASPTPWSASPAPWRPPGRSRPPRPATRPSSPRCAPTTRWATPTTARASSASPAGPPAAPPPPATPPTTSGPC
ncbi:hypothetical protein [Streptomyces bauhiniae]|uniref:hypothetical protein n=1 Tax=Streptomyces bauhiniae TaxID=2340725 RepID=UPI0035D73E7B